MVAVEIGKGTKIWHYTNIYETAKIGKNCVIGSYVEIGDEVIIGDNCKIEAFAFIPKGVTIGNNVFIAPHVCFTDDKYPKVNGNWKLLSTIVEDNVVIGANSTILPGITIGKGSLIGAGSIVTKNIKPNTTLIQKLEKLNSIKAITQICR